MKYEIGTEAIVIKAGSHEFELGERIILAGYGDGIMKFTNLDKSDHWFMNLSEIKFIESEFNLADYLPFPKEGLLVTLKNGLNAKLYHDLSGTDYVGQYPILGVIGTEQIVQFSLSGKVVPAYHSSLDIAKVGCTEFPEGMWDVVDTKWEYLAIDEDGESWFFVSKPYIDTDGSIGFWEHGDGDFEQNLVIPITTTDWTKSLTKRPKHA